MIAGADFVIVGLSPWYMDLGSNCKNIARQLSRHNRVLYVNLPLDRSSIRHRKEEAGIRRHMEIIEQKQGDLTEVQPNLWVYYPPTILESINRIPFTSVFSLFNRINNRKFAADIRDAMRRLEMKDAFLFNDNEIFRCFYLKDFLQPRLYIYYSRDYLLGVDYWKKHGTSLEPKHIARADVGVANSEYLAKYLQKYNPNSYYIGQGCDLATFDASKSYPVPADLQGISHPVIGYIGAISSLRIDAEAIRRIAVERPQYQLVLVGPEDEVFQRSDLHNYPNIHFLGRKPIGDLPAYAAAFDVCINPQLINPVTIGNYPLKVDEYLAMGRPVVATRTDAMRIFGEHAYLAEGPADYPALVDRALAEDTAERRTQRIALAHSHSWENSVGVLSAAIEKTLAARG